MRRLSGRLPLVSAGLASVAALMFVGATQINPVAADEPPHALGLRWSPSPASDGLKAFAGLEDDRAGSHKGVKHIMVDGNEYRFEMHTRDRDGSDRQRNEVRGIAKGGRIDMHRNQTWRYTYQMFIPSSLKGTTSFTHIFQVKHTSVASPVVTMSLFRTGSTEKIEMRMYGEGAAKVGQTNLAPLKNKWIDVEIEIRLADAGRLRLVLKDGDRTVVDAARSGDTWLGGSQAHPKWGIYRSLGDRGQLENTHLRLRNMRAYD
jgi:chitin-binding protein